MTAKVLYRLSGVSGLISAALLLILGFGALVPVIQEQPLPIFQSLNLDLAAGYAHIFFTFVLIGVYFIQYKKLGWLGLVGFILAMIANALFTSSQIISSYITLNLDPVIEVLIFPGLIVGLLLLAVANQRSGILPKWPFWLMFLGHIVNSLVPFIISQVFKIDLESGPNGAPTLPISLFAGGIAWLSIVLIRSQNLSISSAETSARKPGVKLATLIRLAGIFAVLSGFFNLTLGIGELFVESHTSRAYSVLSLIAGFGHIFLMFVFVAVYLIGYQKLGWLGLIGFFLAITANSLFTIGQLITAYFGQLTGFPGFLAGPLFIIGLLLLAWANHNVGIVPKWAVWLLFIGQLANLLNPTSIVLIQIAIFAAGILWIGVYLLKLVMTEEETIPIPAL